MREVSAVIEESDGGNGARRVRGEGGSGAKGEDGEETLYGHEGQSTLNFALASSLANAESTTTAEVSCHLVGIRHGSDAARGAHDVVESPP